MAYTPIPTWPAPSTGGGGGGVTAHGDLTGRNAANQHTIAAITDLQAALDGIGGVNYVVTADTDLTGSPPGLVAIAAEEDVTVTLPPLATSEADEWRVVNAVGVNAVIATQLGDSIFSPTGTTLGPGSAILIRGVNAFSLWLVVPQTGTTTLLNAPDGTGNLTAGVDTVQKLMEEVDGLPFTPTADLGGAALLDVGLGAGEVMPGDTPFTPLNIIVPGRYIRTGERGGAAVPVSNRLYYLPIWIPETTTFDRIGAFHEANVGGAGSVARLGIYASVGNQPSGTPVVSASIATDTATAFKTATINQQLTRGLWWLAIVSQPTSSTPSFSWGPPQIQLGSTDGTSSGVWFEAAAGTLPDPAAPGGTASTQPPLLYLRPA